MVDYGHNNVSPEQVGENLAQCVMLYRANEENSLPNGISALRPDLLARKCTRLHFDREPEKFWRWVVTAEIVDSRKRRIVAISNLPVKRPGETTRYRAVI